MPSGSSGVRTHLASVGFFLLCNLLFSASELVVQHLIFLGGIPGNVRALILRSLMQAPFPALALITQFILCLLVLSVVSEGLRALFGLRSRWIMQAYVLLVSVTFNLAEIPQVFSMTVSSFTMDVARLLLLPLLLSLPLSLLARSLHSRSYRCVARALTGCGLIVVAILFCHRGPTFLDRILTPDVSQFPDGSLLILGIDSLRPDFVAGYVKDNPKSELASLISEGVQFDNMVTTTAKTHASLSGLLTGQRPEEHGIRDNLVPGFRDTDRLYVDKGLIKAVRDKGFRTKLVFDETKFADFQAGRAFDVVKAPRYDFLNILVTEVFRSSLFWSYFANGLGRAIVPTSRMNAAFSFGYQPKEFLGEVYEQLAVPENAPVLLITHTCSLHYPGDSRAPYIQRYQTNPAKLVTRYPNYFQPSRDQDEKLMEQYRGLARGKFDMIMDELLEPLLRQLRQSGRLNKIHLLLMSDHGETFWTSGLRYSRLQLPYHGNPAILDEDSNFMYALLKSPGLVPERIPQIQSIVDLTRYLREILEPKRPLRISRFIEPNPMRYSESGVLGRGIFNSSLLLSWRIVEDGWEFLKDGGLQIHPKQIDNIIIQKTRSIYLNDRHWSFFPTDFGYETLVCITPTCWSPNEKDKLQLSHVTSFLNHESAVDQANGVALEFDGRLGATGDATVRRDVPRSLVAAARWLRAAQGLNAYGDYRGAYATWFSILEDESLAPELRYRAFRSLLYLCPTHTTLHLCFGFNRWYKSKELGQNALEMWRNFDPEMRRFLEGRKMLRSGENAVVDGDQFVEILKAAIQKGDQKNLREFVRSPSRSAEMQNTFSRRFWAALKSEPVTTHAAAVAEISEIRSNFKSVFALRLFEVDVDWVTFLRDYSRFTKVDVYSKEMEQFLVEGRLPFIFTIQTALPAILKGIDLKCYYQKVQPWLLEQTSEVDAKWPRTLLAIARKQTFCPAD